MNGSACVLKCWTLVVLATLAATAQTRGEILGYTVKAVGADKIDNILII